MNSVSDFGDTIVASITGAQRAAVALIRCSGSLAPQIARTLCKKAGPDSRRVYLTSIMCAGKSVDEGFLIFFEEGHSYTGEASFELSCHGSPEIVRGIVAECIRLGAREARPGEFTERAFLSGRLDLTQAEAIRETVEAATEAQQRRAKLLREGFLAVRVRALQERIGAELAKAEATVDFSEEIGELDRNASRLALSDCIREIEQILSGYTASRLIRNGLRVALVGRPNVGKSSLLNALVGMERAIVTEIPGTTRDTIEETVSIGGFPVVLTDTAGIREGADTIERLGVERSRAAIDTADEVWFVFEAQHGWLADDEALLSSLSVAPSLLIGNKSDLADRSNGSDKTISVSALKFQGLELIERHVSSVFESGNFENALINERHRDDLLQTRTYLEHSCETLSTDMPTDLACVDLYGAMQTLGRITGETAPDEIIERVFRQFCIGK